MISLYALGSHFYFITVLSHAVLRHDGRAGRGGGNVEQGAASGPHSRRRARPEPGADYERGAAQSHVGDEEAPECVKRTCIKN